MLMPQSLTKQHVWKMKCLKTDVHYPSSGNDAICHEVLQELSVGLVSILLPYCMSHSMARFMDELLSSMAGACTVHGQSTFPTCVLLCHGQTARDTLVSG